MNLVVSFLPVFVGRSSKFSSVDLMYSLLFNVHIYTPFKCIFQIHRLDKFPVVSFSSFLIETSQLLIIVLLLHPYLYPVCYQHKPGYTHTYCSTYGLTEGRSHMTGSAIFDLKPISSSLSYNHFRYMSGHALKGCPAARLETMVLVKRSYVLVCFVDKRQ